MVKIFGICFFLSEKTRLYRYYQTKYQLVIIHKSYNEIVDKTVPFTSPKHDKSEILLFWGSSNSLLLQIDSLIFSDFIVLQGLMQVN